MSDLIREYAEDIVLKELKDFLSAHTRMLQELGKFCVVSSILDIPSDFIVVDGIRVPVHVKSLHRHGPVIALHCSQMTRFERTLIRRGPLDKDHFEDFVTEERNELAQTDPYVQNSATVMRTADLSY